MVAAGDAGRSLVIHQFALDLQERLLWLRCFWKQLREEWRNGLPPWEGPLSSRRGVQWWWNFNPRCSECFESCTRDWFGSMKVHSSFSRMLEKLPVNSNLKCELQLKDPPSLHASCLKPYHEDNEDPTRGILHQAPVTMTTSFDKVVESVLDARIVHRQGVPSYEEYLVMWKGLLHGETSWDCDDILWQFEKHISEFLISPGQRCRCQVGKIVTI